MQTYKEILDYFIKKKKKMGFYSSQNYWSRDRTGYNVPECHMSCWYEEARDLWSLSSHYDVFRDCVEAEVYYDRVDYWKTRRSNWDRTPQKNGSFRKAEQHKKKILSEEEIRKREWRKKKKDRRDQGSNLDQRKGWTCLQRDSNRSERRGVKAKMQSGKWEAYGKTYWTGEDQMTPEFSKNDWDNYIHPHKREHLNPWDYY